MPMEVSEHATKCTQPLSDDVDIFNAVKSGNLSSVQMVVERVGSEVFKRLDPQGHTTAHWACLGGNTAILDLIIENGGSYDTLSEGEMGQRPIHWAAHQGHIDVVQKLLQLGVEVDVGDTSGKTPLLVAAQNGKTALVAYLISLKANRHLVDKDGDSALHWAAYNGHSETMRLLAHLGCNTELPDAFLMRPLHIASLRGHVDAVRDLCLVDNADMTARDINNETPKMLATRKGKFDVVGALERAEMGRSGSMWPRGVNTLMDGSFMGGSNNNRLLNMVRFFVCFYGYPLFAYYILLPHFNDLLISSTLFCMLGVVFWYSLCKSSKSDPGFVPKHQKEYSTIMQNLANYQDIREATDALSRLCHTCCCVKPLRSKHCRHCNRCVKEFDHHCFYVGNCVGVGNRQWFMLFVNCSFVSLMITMLFVHFLISIGEETYVVWLGALMLFGFVLLSGLVSLSILFNIMYGLTTNEMVNWRRYKYLQDDQGRFCNRLSKGFVGNLREYLKLEAGHANKKCDSVVSVV